MVQQSSGSHRHSHDANQFKLKTDHELESFSDSHGTIYKLALALFSLLAYAYLFFFPLMTLLFCWLIFQQAQQLNSYLDFVLLASELTGLVITARMSLFLYRLSFPVPAGNCLSEEDAPYLYTLIREVQLESQSPDIHNICISRHYESKIIRTPTSGYALRFSNTLVLGLPLMQSLSTRQLKVVIKRELLHISHISRHIDGWFYHLRNLWPQYQQLSCEAWSINRLFIQLFFSWYAPLYRLLSQAAARHEELYVDKALHQQSHHDSLVDILTTMGISKAFLYEQHLPHLLNKAYKHEFPPYLPYESFERNLRSKIDNTFCQSWLDKTLNQAQTEKDFPELKLRIFNLGLDSIWLPDLNQGSSASKLLDENLFLLCQQMDDDWFKYNEAEWNTRFKTGQGEQNKLKEYHVLLKQNILSDQKTREYIQLAQKYLDETEASELYKQILKTDFHDPRISFEIGRTLLKQLDADGVDSMHRTLDMDSSYTVIVCQLLTQYYSQTGDKKMAQSYRRRALEYQVEAV